MTALEFGRLVGLTEPRNANRWALAPGHPSFRRPARRYMPRIREITGGKVNGASFDAPPAAQEAA